MVDIANENEAITFILIGSANRTKGAPKDTLHIMLNAPDEDTAVRNTLNALTDEGFVEADLDQIGTIDDMPDEEPHASAYQGAQEGEIAIVSIRR